MPNMSDESNLREARSRWRRGFGPSAALAAVVAVGLELLYDPSAGELMGVFVLSFFIGVVAFGLILGD